MIINQHDGVLLSIILGVLLIIFDLFYIKKRFDLIFVFVNVNMLSIIMYLLYLSDWLQHITVDFLLLNILYLVSFIVGYRFYKRNDESPPQAIALSRTCVKKLSMLNSMAFFAYLAAFIYEWKMAGWVLPLFSGNRLLAYMTFPVKYVHYIVISGVCIGILSFYISFKYRYRVKWNLLITFSILALNISILARQVALFQIFGMLFLYTTEKKIRITYFRIAILLILGIFAMSCIGSLRTGGTFNDSSILELGQVKNFSKVLTPLGWVYLYFTTPLENFRNIYSATTNFKYGGLSVLRPLYVMFQRKDSPMVNFDFDPVSAGGFIALGYGAYVYTDFGYFGFLFMLVVGAISKYIMTSNKLYLHLFSSIWLFAIFTTATNGNITEFFYLVFLSYFFIVCKLSRFVITKQSVGVQLAH